MCRSPPPSQQDAPDRLQRRAQPSTHRSRRRRGGRASGRGSRLLGPERPRHGIQHRAGRAGGDRAQRTVIVVLGDARPVSANLGSPRLGCLKRRYAESIGVIGWSGSS